MLFACYVMLALQNHVYSNCEQFYCFILGIHLKRSLNRNAVLSAFKQKQIVRLVVYCIIMLSRMLLAL